MKVFDQLKKTFLGKALLLALAAASFLSTRGDDAALSDNIIATNSPAFFFSPANWASETEGGIRASWCPGAYFRVAWTTSSSSPTANLILDVSTFRAAGFTPPLIAYCVDGVWVPHVPCADQIPIKNLAGSGPHLLTVYVESAQQAKRWGTGDEKGINQVRVKGLAVDSRTTPGQAPQASRWAWIIGDSITEGILSDPGGADNLSCWSHLLGLGLESLGYEYGISACGYSGWLRPGDYEGDVPAFYFVSNGLYDERRSRWDKINAQTTLLDSAGRLSGYGKIDQEPALIILNLGTNDALNKVADDDLKRSIFGGLNALQTAAPQAKIFVVIPFGQFEADKLKAAVQEVNLGKDNRITLIDLGDKAARALTVTKFWGDLHPNTTRLC